LLQLSKHTRIVPPICRLHDENDPSTLSITTVQKPNTLNITKVVNTKKRHRWTGVTTYKITDD